MIKDLEKLGFTPNEAKVFTALLESGESPTGPIIKRTGMHRNIVYEALDSLKASGLVREAVKAGKKFFKVGNPQVLIDRAQEEMALAGRVAEQISKKFTTTAPEITVYEDKPGWQTAYRRTVKTLGDNDQVYTFGAGGDKWVEAMGDYFVAYEKFCLEHHIKYRMLAYEWQRKELEAHQGLLVREVRYLPERNRAPANTEIFESKIFIQIYTDPVVLIEVISPAVAKSYIQHFETMWEMAKA